MGGFGSGRQKYATTPTVEECYQIDADHLTDGVEHPGNAYAKRRWDPRRYATVDLTVHFEGIDDAERVTHVRLEYSVDPIRDDRFEEEHPVGIEYTEPNFGGVRPWFRCPGIVDGEVCKRRVRKLYLPAGGRYWLCRECYDLGYRSSRSSGNELKRAEQRYGKAFAKADAENRHPHPNSNTAPYLPDKPKGMHQDTYEDLLDDVREARREWDDRWMEKVREYLGQAYTDSEHAAQAFGYSDRE